MGLSVDLTLNARQAQANVKDLGEALGKVSGSLDDVARDGSQAGDNLERTFRDMVRGAEKADDAIDKIGDSGKRGFGRAAEAGGEFKSEALANFSEVTSSFDGSMSSIGDLAQGTLGGLAANLPGIGLAAGIAAAGVGLITAGLDAAEERRKALQERANDLASAYIDAGNSVLSAATVASRASDILTDPEQRKEAQQLAQALGIDLPAAVQALAGDQNALAAANSIVTSSQSEYLDLLKQSADYTSGEFSAVDRTRLGQLQQQRDKLTELNGVQTDATATYQAQQQVLQNLINTSSGATKEVDALGNSLYTLPDSTQVLVAADTGQATTNVSSFQGDLDGIPETVTSTVRLRVDDSEVRAYVPPDKTGTVRFRNGGMTAWDT